MPVGQLAPEVGDCTEAAQKPQPCRNQKRAAKLHPPPPCCNPVPCLVGTCKTCCIAYHDIASMHQLLSLLFKVSAIAG